MENDLRIQLTQPGNGIRAVLDQSVHQGGVVQTAAAEQGVQLEELGRVKVALRVGLVLFPLFGNDLAELLYPLVVGIILDLLQGALDAGALAEFIGLLPLGGGSVHAAGGTGGVAADDALALKEQDRSAGIGSRDGRGHAGTAGADDHDVDIVQHVSFDLIRRLRGDLEISRVITAGFQRSGNRSQNALGCDGGAADGVEQDALLINNGSRNLRDGNRADAIGLGLGYDRDGDDLVTDHHNLNLDGAVSAVRRTVQRLLVGSKADDAEGQHQGKNEKQGQRFLHVSPPDKIIVVLL